MTKNEPKRGFSKDEFAARTARAQAGMSASDLDGVLLTTEAEIRYFSGFHTLFWQSPTRPWFLFVPAEGKPIAIIPEIGRDLMRQTWLDDIRCWSAPQPHDDGISLLTELLSPYASQGKTIGIMKGHETHLRMPLGDYERLMANLKSLKIADATSLILGLRQVKSEAEIEKIAHICAIGSRTFARVPEIASEGQPLSQVFRAFRQEGLAQGADDVPYLVGGAEKGGYSDVISPPSEKPLAQGDILMLDSGANWDGYFCDFDRNWAVGSADDASLCAYDLLWRATEAGIEAVRPGATCSEVFHAMQKVIAEGDNQGGDIGRLGHGLGMQLTESPSLAAWDETQITESMVLTLEPSMSYGKGRLMVHEENLVVRASGAELLTERASPELPIIS